MLNFLIHITYDANKIRNVNYFHRMRSEIIKTIDLCDVIICKRALLVNMSYFERNEDDQDWQTDDEDNMVNGKC